MTGFRSIRSIALPEDPNQGKRPGWDWRLFLLRLFVVLAFAVLLGQLWKLQIVEGHSFRQLADVNRFRVSPVVAPRGIIYDRNGKIVAANTPSFQVSIVPAAIPKDDPQPMYLRLSGLLSMSPAEIADKVDKHKGDDYTPVPIKSDVDRDIVLRVEEDHRKLPGVIVVPESSRIYPYGPLLSHILGYMLPITEEQFAAKQSDEQAGYRPSDKIGASGIEASYEHELRGRTGRKLYEVDATERPIADLSIDSPTPGHNLVLSIDVDLQRDVERILKEGMGESKSAVAIVMRPQDGQVLAMVSLPSYDNNLFSGTVRPAELEKVMNDPLKPMLNYATSGTFPPGSTFKLATALASLQTGVANADTEIVCRGALYIPNQYNPALSARLPCWGVHGRQDFVRGLANSCDVYFYTLAGGFEDFDGLGVDRLGEYARLLGYGAPTGIDIPGEVAGLIPTAEWKEATWSEPWVTGDTYNMGIGQGFVLATPLQVANLTNAVANDGHLLSPRLLTAVTEAEDDLVLRELDPVEIRRLPVSQENLDLVQQGMREVMLNPDVKHVNVPELKIAGKTGTAEFPGIRDEKGILPTHGWFTAYAPYDNPEISVTVFLQRGGGPSNAVPLAMRIFRNYFGHPDLPPTPTPAGGAQ